MLQEWLSGINRIARRKLALLGAILILAVIAGCLVQKRMEKNGTKSGILSLVSGRTQNGSAAQERNGERGKSSAEEEDAKSGEERTENEDEAALTEEQKKEIEAVEASIVPGQYPIMGMSSITRQQMIDYFKESGETYPAEILGQGGAEDIETFCQIYYEEAVKEGVRPEVAFAQTMKETGWLQYGGDAKITQYNFAGIGTTGGGVPGNSYPDVRTGVRAQIQHLKAYATDTALSGECVDDRYQYVTKGSAPYVEWLGQKENPQGCGWATGENYGYDIVEMIHDMRK